MKIAARLAAGGRGCRTSLELKHPASEAPAVDHRA